MTDVELQTGELGDRVAREAGAPAITMGRRVYFQTGAYQVHTAAGKEMLAHKLAHVAQQGGAGMRSVAMPLGARGDAAEREARRAAPPPR